MPKNPPVDDTTADVTNEPEPAEFNPQPPSSETAPSGEMSEEKIAVLDVPLKLTDAQEKEVVRYLQENLPKMQCSEKEEKRIKAMYAMYDMAAEKRNFPYENAPSHASSDAYDKLNEFLDYAEGAFLQQRTTHSLDREDSPFPLGEADCRRIEKTVHRECVIKNGYIREFRLILFEACFIGSSYVDVRETYDIEPRRVRVVIKDDADLKQEIENGLDADSITEARKAIQEGRRYLGERDTLKIKNVGPVPKRVDQTKFYYPRNTSSINEWQLAGVKQFYTRSALMELARRGELDKKKVEEAIAKRRALYQQSLDQKEQKDKGKSLVGEEVKPSALDSDWTPDINSYGVQVMGETYDDEFAVFRVPMLFNVPTKFDSTGSLRTWIEVLFCPAGENVLGAKFCPDGFPYKQVQLRPVPYRANGVGIGQARFATNKIDSDLKSLYFACLEQEIGTPLILRDGSGLWSLDFRDYPGSVAYTQDPAHDIAFPARPEKSRLAVEGMKMVLGSSPGANKGADYASGRREVLMFQERINLIKARIHTLSLDFDELFNAMWKVYCRMARLNVEGKQKYLPWVYSKPPDGKTLYVLESEMIPDLIWSCSASAVAMNPDERLQKCVMTKQMILDQFPAAVNIPRLQIGWQEYLADNLDLPVAQRPKLLLTKQDIAQYQASLGQQGGERPGAPGGAGAGVPPMVAQSPSTPIRQPAAKGQPTPPNPFREQAIQQSLNTQTPFQK